jgi:hypothetical protein
MGQRKLCYLPQCWSCHTYTLSAAGMTQHVQRVHGRMSRGEPWGYRRVYARCGVAFVARAQRDARARRARTRLSAPHLEIRG